MRQRHGASVRDDNERESEREQGQAAQPDLSRDIAVLDIAIVDMSHDGGGYVLAERNARTTHCGRY